MSFPRSFFTRELSGFRNTMAFFRKVVCERERLEVQLAESLSACHAARSREESFREACREADLSSQPDELCTEFEMFARGHAETLRKLHADALQRLELCADELMRHQALEEMLSSTPVGGVSPWRQGANALLDSAEFAGKGIGVAAQAMWAFLSGAD